MLDQGILGGYDKSHMNNPAEVNTQNKPLYTTPKMIAGSVGADVLWQLLCQYVDPRFEDTKVGEMDYEWFMAIIYPIGLMLVIGGFAYAHSYYTSKPTTDENSKKSQAEENNIIAGGVVFGLIGWMLGYLLADEEYGYHFNDAQTVAAVGTGSMITMMMYSLFVDYKKNQLASKGTYAVASSCFFLAAAGWYLCYKLPEILMAHGFSENKEVGGFVSVLATAVVSAASLGILYLWEQKGEQNKKPASASSQTTPLLTK